MPSFRTLRVVELLAAREGLQRVRLADGSRAYALTALTGEVSPGDEVVVNTTAVDLGLGTGGWHVVHWNLSRTELHQPGPGHIMKVRYTSLQADTGAAEESPDADADDDVDGGDGDGAGGPVPARLVGTPVLVGSLHSQLGVIAAVVRALRPDARISYVMTDGAALPIALSDLVADLRARGLVDGTVTCGHAFGGDLEAVSVPSGIHLAVHRQRADVVVCTMGPGVVGTASPLGTTAVEVAGILTAVHQLGGRAIAVARASSGDARPRHRGISHHTLTALSLTPVGVPVPLPAGAGLAAAVPAPHRAVEVAPIDVAAVLAAAGLRVTTMGRGPAEDPLFFATAAAAACHAVDITSPTGTVAPT